MGVAVLARLLAGLILVLLSGCVSGQNERPAAARPPGGDGLVFTERSSEPLIGFGTLSLQIVAGPGVDKGALRKFRELFTAELAQQLKKQTQLTLVGRDTYSDLTLKIQVVELAYVDFFARISGVSLFSEAALDADIQLLDNYKRRTLWQARATAQSLQVEGAVAASTTTQVISLADLIAKAFRDDMY